MPNQLPASGAHVLWTWAAVLVLNITARTWAAGHPDSAFAKAVAFSV